MQKQRRWAVRNAFRVHGMNQAQLVHDGSLLFHVLAKLDTWDIRGDRYCSEWGGGTPTAVWSCYDVFRNENGEIIWIGDRNDRYRAAMVDGNHMPEQ